MIRSWSESRMRLLMISAMPTLTNVRLVSRNWRIVHSVRRRISTLRSPLPPAFVFDIVSALNTSTVEVPDHPLVRMASCSEARRSWSQRGTRSGSSTVTIRSTGGIASVSRRAKTSSHHIWHRKIPYIFVRDGSYSLTRSRKE